MSVVNFIAEIKIEFRSSPNSISLKTRKRRCRGRKVQTSVVARAVPSKAFPIQGSSSCRRDVATVSVPWLCRDVRGCDTINGREFRLRSPLRSPAQWSGVVQSNPFFDWTLPVRRCHREHALSRP